MYDNFMLCKCEVSCVKQDSFSKVAMSIVMLMDVNVQVVQCTAVHLCPKHTIAGKVPKDMIAEEGGKGDL